MDMNAYVYDRFTRTFTITADMELGINLSIGLDPQGQPAIDMTLAGLDASGLVLGVENAEFVREASSLQLLIPGMVELLGGFLGADTNLGGMLEGILGSGMGMGDLGGLQISGLKLNKASSAQDDYLIASLTLGVSQEAAAQVR